MKYNFIKERERGEGIKINIKNKIYRINIILWNK